jgi:hypothetical protein
MAKLEEYQRERRFDSSTKHLSLPRKSPGQQKKTLSWCKNTPLGACTTTFAWPSTARTLAALLTNAWPCKPRIIRLSVADSKSKIPRSSYGAGTVMVWDRGTFRVEGDADALKQLERGEIKFNLNGEILRNSFVLINYRGANGARSPGAHRPE